MFFSIANSQKICEDFKFNIEELFEIKRGRVISKQYIQQNKGSFPIYSSATLNNGEIGKINTYDFNGEYLTWTTDGCYAGSVFYREGKFSITNVCGLLSIKGNYQHQINLKFFKFILNSITKKYINSTISIPKLMSNTMAKIPIIVPPIEIQNKISQILEPIEQLLKNQVKLTFSYNKKYNFYKKNIIKLLLNGV